MSQEAVPVDPHETLYLPMRRRFLSEYVSTPEGTQELRIYFGDKEITIDEPELHSFGENLLKQDHFMAGNATTWSLGEPYSWERVKDLLDALIAEGILSREAPKPTSESEYHRKFLEAEARREAPAEPLWWNPDCSRVTEKLVGRPLELGHLEAVLSVHRVSHPALDAEGRQLGEINVFPDAMRMKIPTEWRVCNYPGSRYRDDALMNVTALKSAKRHWNAMTRGVLAIREEFLRRYQLLPERGWRLGDLHSLVCSILALPSLLLMRANDPVPNGALDPVVSAMFRVTDGVRIVTTDLLFREEKPMAYDAPITAAELFRITERDNYFLSTRGVCAGPQAMVEEFFATLFDGRSEASVPAESAAWDTEIPAAVDYGLYGLQLYSLRFNLWSHMCRTYDVLNTVLLEVKAEPAGVWGRLRNRVIDDWQIISSNRFHSASQWDWSESRCREVFDRAQRGLRGFREDAWVRLQEVFTPARDEADRNARQQLGELLRLRAGSPSGTWGNVLEAVADAVAGFLAVERSVLRALESTQRQINVLLQRPQPGTKLSGTDLTLSHRLLMGTSSALPYLMDVLQDELAIVVENTENGTRFSDGATA